MAVLEEAETEDAGAGATEAGGEEAFMMTATATDLVPVVALRKGAGAAIETTVIVAIDGWTPTPVGIPATTAILVIPANENCCDLRALNETVSAVHPRRHRRQTQRTFLPRL